MPGYDGQIARINDHLERKDYYAAHQAYRTIANRQVRKKDYKDAIDLLHSGSLLLFKQNQSKSGGDLAVYLAEIFKQEPLTNELRSKIYEILSAFPKDEPSRKTFIADLGTSDGSINKFIGRLFAKEGAYYKAESYFILSDSSDACESYTQMLYTWYKSDETHTCPLYCARAVLNYLLLRNIPLAAKAHQLFVQNLVRDSPSLPSQVVTVESLSTTVYPSIPGLNFLQLLILSAPRGDTFLYALLKRRYKSFLEESGLADAVAAVGEIYFGIVVQKGGNNMLASLMGSLFAPPSNTPGSASQAPSSSIQGGSLD